MQWYPWGQEAFRTCEIKRENKLIFLSIGYSTCYWCHVMERESFEDESVAKLINASFIAIKVDREERPGTRRTIHAGRRLLNGRGGWPNSLWLTPDRKPFLAGTYIPKARFKQILTQVASAWKHSPNTVNRKDATTGRLGPHASLQKFAPGGLSINLQSIKPLRKRHAISTPSTAVLAVRENSRRTAACCCVEEYRRSSDKRLLQMITGRTLDEMVDGGIHDQIGGGFHRYSTDARWFGRTSRRCCMTTLNSCVCIPMRIC